MEIETDRLHKATHDLERAEKYHCISGQKLHGVQTSRTPYIHGLQRLRWFRCATQTQAQVSKHTCGAGLS